MQFLPRGGVYWGEEKTATLEVTAPEASGTLYPRGQDGKGSGMTG